MILQPNGDPVGTKRDSVEALAHECFAASQRMSANNPHKSLMLRSAQAVIDLAMRLRQLEARG